MTKHEWSNAITIAAWVVAKAEATTPEERWVIYAREMEKALKAGYPDDDGGLTPVG